MLPCLWRDPQSSYFWAFFALNDMESDGLYNDIDSFLKILRYERHYSPHTLKNYRIDLHEAADFFHTQTIDSWKAVEEKNIHALMASKRKKNISARSINRQLSVLRTFFQYLIRLGIIQENKAKGVLALKSAHPLPKALEVDQVAKLLEYPALNAISIRDAALMELLYSAGLRVAEIVSLNMTDLDLKEQQTRVMGKGNQARIALIGRYAVAALNAWLRIRADIAKPEEPALFVNKYGQRLTTRAVQYRLARIGIQQGLESRVSPHRLRHSFASHLLESSNDLRSVQELLGHANLSTTQIYTKINFQQLANVYDQCHPRANPVSQDKKE